MISGIIYSTIVDVDEMATTGVNVTGAVARSLTTSDSGTRTTARYYKKTISYVCVHYECCVTQIRYLLSGSGITVIRDSFVIKP